MSNNNDFTVLVTGATGNQGSQVALHLLQSSPKTNIKIRCLVRDPNNKVAQHLKSAGATLYPGNFDDLESLQQATATCQAVYMNTFPGPNSIEPKHAKNILSIAEQENVKQIICSTVTRADGSHEFDILNQVGPDHFMQDYWRDKARVEDMVRQYRASPGSGSGSEDAEVGGISWTILQPAWLMSNFVAPGAFAYWSSRLRDEDSVLETAFGKGRKVQLVSGHDVGACAAAAILEFNDRRMNEKRGVEEKKNRFYDRKTIRLASDELTIEEIAGVMSDVGGRRIRVEYLEAKHVDVEILTNPFLFSQRWATIDGTNVDMEKVKALKLNTLDFRTFLEKNREALIEAVTPSSTS